VLDCPEYDTIPDADERRRWREAMAERGYDMWPSGPIYGRSYNDAYPFTDWTLDPLGYLARMQELIDDGFAVNFHAIPDSGDAVLPDGTPNFAWLDRVLKPIYQSPEYQAVLGHGEITIAWEPNWESAVWERAAKWVLECFPNAEMIWVHMEPGHSGPGKGHEDEGFCWRRIAPYVDGCSFQSRQFGERDYAWDDKLGRPSRRTRRQQFLREVWDICRRFESGLNGWPTAGRTGKRLVLRVGEYASYWRYNNAATEAEANAFGDLIWSTPAYEDPDNAGEIIDLTPYLPLSLGDGSTSLGIPTAAPR